MNAQVWGPKMWDIMAVSARRLPVEDFKQVLSDLKLLLPCVHCRRSYVAYTERNTPAACIRDSESAAQYVWALHDLVNVKLGRSVSCIPYSVLAARHATFTSVISWWDPLDMLGVIAYQLDDPAQVPAFERFARQMGALSVICGGPPSVEVPASSHTESAPDTAWRRAFACYNAGREAVGLSDLSETEFSSQYDACRAPQDTPAPAASRRKASSRRRR